MDPLAVIVLAAGLGKRMRSELPKVVFSTIQKPLIQHVLQAVSQLKPAKVIVVTGHKRDVVERAVRDGASPKTYPLTNITYAVQEKQLGTGDAAKSALPALKDFTGTVLILSGDTPLITAATLQALIETQHHEKATLALLTFQAPGQQSYGRVIRQGPGADVQRVAELKDCSAKEVLLNEYNAGIYAVDSAFLSPALKDLNNNNAQQEYYLTDIVAKAAKEGQKIASILSPDAHELQGVNTPYELTLVNCTLSQRRMRELIDAGVQIKDPLSVFVACSASVAPGATIGPNVQILGSSKIEAGVVIEGTAFLQDVTVREGALIRLSVRAQEAVIGKNCAVGPFAHLRPGTILEDDVHIGNFVEAKKAHLHKGAKANHLTYLGDCEVGSASNVGAGTITCNYDGYNKHKTTIGKNVFIGSNTALVAPVTIGDGASIGAGSVISKSVKPDSLALTRAPQIEREGWAKHRREKHGKK